MKCNIASCNPFDPIHPTSFGPAPRLPPTSALVRILFAKLNSLKGVAIPQVAQRTSNFVGAAPSDDSIVDACRDECSNETLDWIAGHVWHKRPRWYQKACSAAAEGSSQRVIDWVNAQVTPTGREPLIAVQAVVAAKLGETRADQPTMLQVAQKISGHIVRLTSENRIWVEIADKHPSIDQVERMVSQIPERTTRSQGLPVT
ncbi:hypothetical protein PR001_g27762 [Phytophthora rubi]|uniref:Uncharacterized protein n=1 Tax=Phytophthora rubi TaxID=129364 RepID=A0A6A3HH23_9STRA|nr:hypothetical protein PR001_g27762 [Phytophthora rubi]